MQGLSLWRGSGRRTLLCDGLHSPSIIARNAADLLVALVLCGASTRHPSAHLPLRLALRCVISWPSLVCRRPPLLRIGSAAVGRVWRCCIRFLGLRCGRFLLVWWLPRSPPWHAFPLALSYGVSMLHPSAHLPLRLCHLLAVPCVSPPSAAPYRVGRPWVGCGGAAWCIGVFGLRCGRCLLVWWLLRYLTWHALPPCFALWRVDAAPLRLSVLSRRVHLPLLPPQKRHKKARKATFRAW